MLFRGENTAFFVGHFVGLPCVFIDIAGSSFIFNIFFVSTLLGGQFNFLTFNELGFCWDWKIRPEFPLTNIFFINIAASAAAFFIFRVVGRQLTAIRSQKLTDRRAGITVSDTITRLLYHEIFKTQQTSDMTGGYKMSLGNLVARTCFAGPLPFVADDDKAHPRAERKGADRAADHEGLYGHAMACPYDLAAIAASCRVPTASSRRAGERARRYVLRGSAPHITLTAKSPPEEPRR